MVEWIPFNYTMRTSVQRDGLPDTLLVFSDVLTPYQSSIIDSWGCMIAASGQAPAELQTWIH